MCKSERVMDPAASYILALAEGLEMANSCRRRMPSVMTGMRPTSDMQRFHVRNRGQSRRESAWVITAGVDPFRT